MATRKSALNSIEVVQAWIHFVHILTLQWMSVASSHLWVLRTFVWYNIVTRAGSMANPKVYSAQETTRKCVSMMNKT
eukprot:3168699-Amphidinium_carterae.1